MEHDTLSPHEHSSEAALESSKAARARIATSTAMMAILLLMVSEIGFHLPRSFSFMEENAKPTTGDQAKTSRVVDREFCENQTWPYIDARCLKRIESPTTVEAQSTLDSNVPPAPPSKIVAPEATAADVQQNLQAEPSNGSLNISTALPPERAPAATPSDTRQVVQRETNRIFDGRVVQASRPKAMPTADPEQFWVPPAPTNDNEAGGDPRHRHSRRGDRHYVGLFGFRF